MAEKLDIERGTAEAFLGVYNILEGTHYEIIEHSDSPDFKCRDNKTGAQINLEITLLEDRPGDIPPILGRREERTGVRGFNTVYPLTGNPDKDTCTLSQFKERINNKCLKDYGPHTALVLRQVVPLWTISDWEMYLEDFQDMIPPMSERTFPKGIWVLTWKDAFNLKDPDIVQLQ